MLETALLLIFISGQEFRAKIVQDLMKKQGIIYFPTQKAFTFKDGYKYLPVLQDNATSYNNISQNHRYDTNRYESWQRRRGSIFDLLCTAQRKKKERRARKKKPFKLRLNQYVRISHLKDAFTRAYDEAYSGEIFQVSNRYFRGK